jgi:flagellar basal body rod protein FlgC
MNKKYYTKIIMFTFFIIFAVSCQKNSEIYLITFNDAQKEFLRNYILVKKYDVKIIENDYYIRINKINKEVLIELLGILHTKTEIIQNNIVNVNTTKTAEGGPFKRSYLKITIENNIEIISDEETKGKIIYDPTHPDAIATGEMKGFVEYPNVDLLAEYYELTETVKIYNSIVEYVNKNYKNIIIEKIHINPYEEILNKIKTEKQIELIIKYIIDNNL